MREKRNGELEGKARVPGEHECDVSGCRGMLRDA